MMFKKKKCGRCGKGLNDKYDFCPSCGNRVNGNSQDDFGMLGKRDVSNEFDDLSNSLLGGFGGKMLGKMLNNTMKMLEKEMQKEMRNAESMPRTNFELRINGKKIDPKNIRISQHPMRVNTNLNQAQKIEAKEFSSKNVSKDKIKLMSGLPKKEPKTNLTRLSDKVIYELEIPGVKSIDDVSIVKLENSIEIKALTKDKVYDKIIPINLPITNFNLEKGKLVLELGEK